MRDYEPDEHDADLMDEGEDTVTCPACGADVYAEADQCPTCGYWFTLDEATSSRHAWWSVLVVLAIVLVLVAVIAVL